MNSAGSQDEVAPIREAVRALCADFPGEYWRRLDRERAYPAEFVAALTKAGFLAALIPEQYGGLGLGVFEYCLFTEELARAWMLCDLCNNVVSPLFSRQCDAANRQVVAL